MAVLLTVLVGAFRVGGSGELETKKDIDNERDNKARDKEKRDKERTK